MRSTHIAALGFGVFAATAILPLCVSLIENRRAPTRPHPSPLPEQPAVDVIIPAYLEAGVISRKIGDLRAASANYEGCLRITVVASDSATAKAAAEADSVLIAGRNGKSAACNIGIQATAGDVIIFTDANCEILPQQGWLEVLLAELQDWHLLSACKVERGGMEGTFWALERRLKASSQTTLGTLAVAGEFLATRRADLHLLESGVILDDLAIAADYALRGLSVTVSPTIQTTEPAATPREQWERRVRIASGLFAEAVPLVPRIAGLQVGRIFLAHKLARLTIGPTAFWAGVMGMALSAAPLSLLVAPIALMLIAAYAGRIPIPRLLWPFAAVTGLQAVPIAGLARAIQASLEPNQSRQNGVWMKVAR